MLMVNNLTGFGAFSGGAPATVSFTDNMVDDSTLTTYTFTTRAIGTAAANRVVVVSVSTERNTGTRTTVSSMTIGGISATLAVALSSVDEEMELWEAVVPTGTTATIVVTLAAASVFCACGIWAVYGSGTTAYNTASHTGTLSLSASLNVPAGGVAIGASAVNTGATWTWGGITENFDATHRSGNRNYSGASLAFAVAQTGLSITATASGGTTSTARLVVASWS
jgi:hypothetical protein